MAHMWFNILGSRGGEDGVVALRDEVASLMSREQIAEAQALARDWFSQHNN